MAGTCKATTAMNNTYMCIHIKCVTCMQNVNLLQQKLWPV